MHLRIFSGCGSSGQSSVTVEGVGFRFSSSAACGNGTDVSSGQLPALYFHLPLTPAMEVTVAPVEAPLSKDFYQQASPTTLLALGELVHWTWEMLHAPLGEQHARGGPTALALIGLMALRLLRSSLGVLFAKDLRGALTAYAARDGSIDDATAEAILALREQLRAILTAVPEFLSPGQEILCSGLHETMRDCFQVFFPMPSLQGESELALHRRCLRRIIAV